MCVKQIDYAIKYFQQLTCRRSPPHPSRAAHFFPKDSSCMDCFWKQI